MQYFIYNDHFFKEGDPAVGPDSRGLRYGDGLFETMRIKNGNLLRTDDHFARLWKGLQLLRFSIPVLFTPEKLMAQIQSLVLKNKHERNARVRLMVVRGEGGLYDAVNHIPHCFIQSWALSDHMGEWNENGLVLGFYRETKKPMDVFSNLKHNNYLPYVMAALHAKENRWNDAFVLNAEGHVCDTTIANFFLVKEDIVYTPALQQGCVAGVMRMHVIKLLKEKGIQVVEGVIAETDLMMADEVFLTNSMYEIRWVRQIQDKNYQNDFVRQIFMDLKATIL